jgi:hypothetical protein
MKRITREWSRGIVIHSGEHYDKSRCVETEDDRSRRERSRREKSHQEESHRERREGERSHRSRRHRDKSHHDESWHSLHDVKMKDLEDKYS